MSVKVLKAEDKGRFSNILFSNKGASEAIVASAISSLEVGTIVTGTVTKIMLEKKDARNEAGPRRETGVLVEFLPGVSGFVHKSNISDSRGVKPSEVLKVGQGGPGEDRQHRHRKPARVAELQGCRRQP